MCIVKTPKIKPGTDKAPEPTIIRNPYLDGMDPVSKALRKGRSSLRIERAGSGATQVAPPAAPARPPVSMPIASNPGGSFTSPVLGGGAGRITRGTNVDYN